MGDWNLRPLRSQATSGVSLTSPSQGSPCIYLCIYMYTHTHIHIYIYICVRTHSEYSESSRTADWEKMQVVQYLRNQDNGVTMMHSSKSHSFPINFDLPGFMWVKRVYVLFYGKKSSNEWTYGFKLGKSTYETIKYVQVKNSMHCLRVSE